MIVDLIDMVLSIGSKDPEQLCSPCKRHSSMTVGAYLAFFLMTVVLMHKGSDGDFSIVLTLSSVVQCFGFLLLTLKVNYQRDVSGLSSRTLECYVIFFIFRLTSTLFKNGYLPMDRSGDWIYQAGDIGSLVLVLNLLYSVHCRYKSTYQADIDNLPIYKAFPALLLLAFYTHGDLNASKFYDGVWMVSLYLDTVSLLPQLWVLTKLGGLVESLTSHFVACMVGSRCLSFAFWLYGHREIGPTNGAANVAGYAIITAHSLQLLLCADFMYYYFKAMRSNSKVLLPTIDV